MNLFDVQLPNLAISGHKEAIGLFLEGNGLRGDEELLVVHANEDWGTIGAGPHFMSMVFINDNDAPLRILRGLSHNVFCLFNGFKCRASFRFELADQLSGDLAISFTVKVNPIQIFFLDLRMATDDTIVNNVNGLGLIIVRMSISLNLFTTSSPSGVADPDMRLGDVLANFLNQSLDAVDRFLRLFSTLDHSSLRLAVFLSESYDTGTVIPSVLQEFNTHGKRGRNVLSFARKNANNATAFGLLLLREIEAA